MKNKLSDLNDHLFERLEWLCDRDVKGEDLAEEITRSRAACGVAQQIIANAALVLDAAKAADGETGKIKLPPLLTD